MRLGDAVSLLVLIASRDRSAWSRQQCDSSAVSALSKLPRWKMRQLATCLAQLLREPGTPHASRQLKRVGLNFGVGEVAEREHVRVGQSRLTAGTAE